MRAAMLVAVAYTAALAIWTIGLLTLTDTADLLGPTLVGTLLTTQCITAAFFTPWLACDAIPRAGPGLAPLVTAPWPLLILAGKVSDVSALAVAASQLWVGGIVVLSYVGARALARIFGAGQPWTIALTALQLAPAVMLWAGRQAWVPWFTG